MRDRSSRGAFRTRAPRASNLGAALLAVACCIAIPARAQIPPTDVLVALDESGSLDPTEFMQEKSFVHEVGLRSGSPESIGPDGRRGLLAFANDARTVLALTPSLQNFSNVAATMVQRGGSSCLACAVASATTLLADASRRRVLVLITDGPDNVDPAGLPAIVSAAQAAGIEIFVLAVGSAWNAAEVALIASDPDDDHLFVTPTFSQLQTVLPPLAIVLFPGYDGDGILSVHDRCPYAFDPRQEDRGGVGAGSTPDLVGDACQCGDVSGDGFVTIADAVQILRASLLPPTSILPRPELCDVGGSVGCSVSDAAIVSRALLVPPKAQIQAACSPPPL